MGLDGGKKEGRENGGGGRGGEKVRVKGKRLEGRPVVVTTSLIVYYFV